MTTRCGGEYGTRSTTPGYEWSAEEGVTAGELLVCELDAEPEHEIHRCGKWWWNTGVLTANDGPLPGAPDRDQVVDAFVAQREEYVGALKRSIEAGPDYHRWSGHAEARRQLAEKLSKASAPVSRPIDRAALAKALFVALQPAHLDDFMFAGERMDDAEALADEVIGLMSGTLRTCRVCGCTPYRACMPNGCAWVPGETDLCTSCTTDQGAVAPPTSTPGGD